MKVLQILPELNAGGVERGTLEIAAYLTQHGHEALVVSQGGRMVPALEKTGARHIALPVHRKSLASLLQVRPLRKLLESEQPDILHIRSRVPGWIAWLAWRGMDPRTRPRLVSTVHGFYSVNRYSAVMTKGGRVIAVSNSIRAHLLENYPATRPEVIRVIPRGIELDQYHPGKQAPEEWLARWRTEHAQFAGKQLLLLPGRITRLKGHEDFFRLIAALKQDGLPVHGLIAGDTHPKKRAYLGDLHRLVDQLALAKDITFLGHRGDVREIMTLCDAVCALSQQPESFGRTVLEALALGKPVVGYDCGGVGELLEEFFPCGKVPPGDSGRLTQAAAAILREHPTPRPVGEPYTLDAMCRATLSIYQELLAAPE